MKKVIILFLLALLSCAPNEKDLKGSKDLQRWKEQAENVEIIRDDLEFPMFMESQMLMLFLVYYMRSAKMILTG